MSELFQVYFKTKFAPDLQTKEFPDGPVPVEQAMETVLRLTKGPASALMHEVIIVDQLDCTNFLWRDGELIFPTRKDIEEARKS